jgi:hypothetical protein
VDGTGPVAGRGVSDVERAGYSTREVGSCCAARNLHRVVRVGGGWNRLRIVSSGGLQ